MPMPKITFTPEVSIALTENEVRVLAFQFDDKVRKPHQQFHLTSNLRGNCPTCEAQNNLFRKLERAMIDHYSIRLNNS